MVLRMHIHVTNHQHIITQTIFITITPFIRFNLCHHFMRCNYFNLSLFNQQPTFIVGLFFVSIRPPVCPGSARQAGLLVERLNVTTILSPTLYFNHFIIINPTYRRPPNLLWNPVRDYLRVLGVSRSSTTIFTF